MEKNTLEAGEQPPPRPLSYAEMVASFVPEKKPDTEELPKQVPILWIKTTNRL